MDYEAVTMCIHDNPELVSCPECGHQQVFYGEGEYECEACRHVYTVYFADQESW